MSSRKTKSLESFSTSETDSVHPADEKVERSVLHEASSFAAEEIASPVPEPQSAPELEPEPQPGSVVEEKHTPEVVAPVMAEPQRSVTESILKPAPTRPAASPKRLHPRNTPKFSKFVR